MSELYEHLAEVYHLLFPARADQLALVRQLAGPPPAKLLDVASGTGEYAAALAGQGHTILGVELDAQMHAEAVARHPALAAQLIQGDMLRLSELNVGTVDLVYCLGNSLPHLASLTEVRAALQQMWLSSRPAGCVLLQTVNFDHVLDRLAREQTEVFPLPTIETTTPAGEPIRFEREYICPICSGQPVPVQLNFRSLLTLADKSYQAHVTLLVLTRELLTQCLPKEADASWHGDFAGAAWSLESKGTILTLR